MLPAGYLVAGSVALILGWLYWQQRSSPRPAWVLSVDGRQVFDRNSPVAESMIEAVGYYRVTSTKKNADGGWALVSTRESMPGPDGQLKPVPAASGKPKLLDQAGTLAGEETSPYVIVMRISQLVAVLGKLPPATLETVIVHTGTAANEMVADGTDFVVVS